MLRKIVHSNCYMCYLFSYTVYVCMFMYFTVGALNLIKIFMYTNFNAERKNYIKVKQSSQVCSYCHFSSFCKQPTFL